MKFEVALTHYPFYRYLSNTYNTIKMQHYVLKMFVLVIYCMMNYQPPPSLWWLKHSHHYYHIKILVGQESGPDVAGSFGGWGPCHRHEVCIILKSQLSTE